MGRGAIDMELRNSYAISHTPLPYDMGRGWIAPFVIGRDDVEGVNIAGKSAYGEMRAHYWLWKNAHFDDDEFVSVQQYRRCFWLPQIAGVPNLFAKHASAVNLDLSLAKVYVNQQEYSDYINAIQNLDLSSLNKWLDGVDMVVARPLIYPKPIREAYGESHRQSDWDVFEPIIKRYGFDGGKTRCLIPDSMYMLTPQLFGEYMAVWREVMAEVERVVEPESDPYQHRNLAFLSERLFSLWAMRLMAERPTIRVQMLPIIEGTFRVV